MAFFPTTQGIGATLQGAGGRLQDFIFGPGTDTPSYESLKKKREVIDAMMQGPVAPAQSHAEGIGGIVNALIARHADRRLSGKEDEARAKAMAEFEAALGGGGYSGAPVASARNAPSGFSLPPQGDRAAQIRDGLIRRGLPEHVADGFLLNFKDESGLDPGINEIAPIVPGSRGGFGLAQWTGPRRVALEQFAAERGVPPSDVDVQLDFLMNELQGSEAGAAKSIMSARDPGSAAAAIATDFLRPAPEHLARRVAEYTGGAPVMSSMGGSSGPDMSRVLQIAQLLENPYLPEGHRLVAQAMIAQAFEGQQAPDVMNVGGRLVDETGRVVYEPPAEPGWRQATPEEAAAYGVSAGQIGPKGEFKPIGEPSTVINNNMGGEKFNDEFAKLDATALSEIGTAGLAATRNLGRIDKLAETLAVAPQGATGAWKQLAGELGIATEGLDDIQAAQALINSLVPEQRQPGSGPMSDADLALFRQSLPRIVNQPGGNEAILNTMRAIAQYDAEGAAIVQRLRAGEINRAQAFEALQSRANPLEGFKAPPSGGAAPATRKRYNPETGAFE